ncbi:MAG: DUF5652 family protein [Parcubacteria group bacterium]
MPNEKIEIIIIALALLWTIPWKGVALWKAAQNRHRVWFILILLVNTLAILEILYIFIFSKKMSEENQPLTRLRRIV